MSKAVSIDLVFVCSRCGSGAIWATNELKCNVCGQDCVIKRRIRYPNGRIAVKSLSQKRAGS